MYYTLKVNLKILIFLLTLNQIFYSKEEQYLENFQYIPKECFKLYFYAINYYNTIPDNLIRDYYIPKVNLLKDMEKNKYKLLLVKKNNKNEKTLTIVITKEKIVKIYHNNIKNYIKIIIPQSTKTINSNYKIWNGEKIDGSYFILFHHQYKLILATNQDLNYIALINYSNLIKSSVEVKKQNEWNYLILPQRKLWFIHKSYYKYKNNNLIIKFNYSNKLEGEYKIYENKESIKIPNIFINNQILHFVLSQKYSFNNDNPFIISPHYNIFIQNNNNNNLNIENDIPLITYLFNYYENFTNNIKEENSFQNKFLLYMKSIKKNFYILDIDNLKKDVDLFPDMPHHILNNFKEELDPINDYIQMIINFIYEKNKLFYKFFNEYYHNSYYNVFCPLVTNFQSINEEIFWLILTLLPFNPVAQENIELIVRYTYRFPSFIRDKINSFIIYHLYISNQWNQINYLFNKDLIDIRLDFITNYIYVYTRYFNGIIPGKDIIKIDPKPKNLNEARLYIEKVFYEIFNDYNYIYNDNKIIYTVKNILFFYKQYKLIFTKEEQNQLFSLLIYIGTKNENNLLSIINNTGFNMELLINHSFCYNPKIYDKYYKNLKKNNEE